MTLARYSRYIFYEEICSTKHDYLHARRLDRRAVLDMLASELARHARRRAERAKLDMLDSEHDEQEEISLVYRSPNTTFL